jgi:hypothetical protein
MKLLNNKNIFSFLILIVLAVFGLFSYQTYQAYNTYQYAEKGNKNIHFIELVDQLADRLEKERIESAVYMGKSGKTDTDPLMESRERVNKSLKAIQKYIKKNKQFGIHKKRVILVKKNIDTVRNMVDTLSTDYRSVFFTSYHQDIFEPLIGAMKIVSSRENDPVLKGYFKGYTEYTALKGNSVLEDTGILFILNGHYPMKDKDLQMWDMLLLRDILPSTKEIGDFKLHKQLKVAIPSDAYHKTGSKERVQILYDAQSAKYRVTTEEWGAQSKRKRAFLSQAKQILLGELHAHSDGFFEKSKSILIKDMIWVMVALIILIIMTVIYYNINKDKQLFEDTLKDIEAVLNKEQQKELQRLIDKRDINNIYRFLVDTIR